MKLQTDLVAVGSLDKNPPAMSGLFACFADGDREITVVGLTREEAQALAAGLYRGFTLSFERQA